MVKGINESEGLQIAEEDLMAILDEVENEVFESETQAEEWFEKKYKEYTDLKIRY